jgi:hypothetical protein
MVIIGHISFDISHLLFESRQDAQTAQMANWEMSNDI